MKRILLNVLVTVLFTALMGCAARPDTSLAEADYRRGDRIARLADDRDACRRAGGIVLMKSAGRVASASPRPQYCVRPGSLGLL